MNSPWAGTYNVYVREDIEASPSFATYQYTNTLQITECILGCMDTLSCNYNASANIDDGGCLLSGCIDLSACNYDVNAFCDDGSCIYPVIWQQSFSICDGDSVVVGSSIYDTTGNYIDTLTAGNGCDSIVYTNVSMPPIIWNQTYLICDGDSIVVGSNLYDTAGAYIDTLNASNGCDSIVYTYILMTPPVIWQQSFSICDGDSVVVGSSIYDTTGNYIDTLTAGNGCDSIVYTNVSMPPIIWNQTYLICDGDSIVVGSNLYDTAGAYIDTLNASNGCDSIVHTYLMVDQNTSSYDTLSVGASIVWNGISLNLSGDYSVTLINSVGCDSIVNLNLTITTTGISDIPNNKSNLVKITDMLGQETPYRRNTPLFYIYDDGTVEKRIVIE